jgi:hypothetical protein
VFNAGTHATTAKTNADAVMHGRVLTRNPLPRRIACTLLGSIALPPACAVCAQSGTRPKDQCSIWCTCCRCRSHLAIGRATRATPPERMLLQHKSRAHKTPAREVGTRRRERRSALGSAVNARPGQCFRLSTSHQSSRKHRAAGQCTVRASGRRHDTLVSRYTTDLRLVRHCSLSVHRPTRANAALTELRMPVEHVGSAAQLRCKSKAASKASNQHCRPPGLLLRLRLLPPALVTAASCMAIRGSSAWVLCSMPVSVLLSAVVQ